MEDMQRNIRTTPSTTTFVIQNVTTEGEEKPRVESGRKSSQSLKSSRTMATKKQGGRKSAQQGGLSMGKRSEANIYGRRQEGKSRQLDGVRKSWGQPESAMKVERKPSMTARKGEDRNRALTHRVVYVNNGKRKGETMSIAIHMPKDRPAILGARMKGLSPRQQEGSFNPPDDVQSKEILQTASSFRFGRTCPTNWEVNSDVSSSTFVVEPAKPIELNTEERGKNPHGEDTPDWEEKTEGRIPGRGSKSGRTRRKNKSRKKCVRFKIYKRRLPKNLRHRWRYPIASEESSAEDRSRGRTRKAPRGVGKQTSEPWIKKGFVWKKDRGMSVLSINSSLGHMNVDDMEDFSCWERVPSGTTTCAWEVFLYTVKKSWSVLSMAAFRKNRLSDTPGEILQILRDGNGFNQWRSPRERGVPESPREDLAPSSPFDVEPSIFQKNIDIRNWVDALRFYASRPEEERFAVATTEDMN